MFGYTLANIIVATNPEMGKMVRDGDKMVQDGTYRKHTVAKNSQFVELDLEAVLADLAAQEPGWGGRDTIIGSPQNVSSTLTTEQVVAVVMKHIPSNS